MQTTNYICDVCKTSKSKEDLSRMSVKTEGIKTSYNQYRSLEIDICKECLEKKGFIVNPKPEAVKEEEIKKKNDVTLKEKIIDILLDLDVVFCE